MNLRAVLLPALMACRILCRPGPDLHEALCKQGQGGESRQGSPDHPTKNRAQFRSAGGGSGISDDGNRFSFHWFTSNDGTTVTRYIETYPDAQLARRAFDEKIHEAFAIIARGTKRDKNGKYTGERAVLRMGKAQGEKQSMYFIYRTLGAELQWIQSSSLDRALEFEKSLDP